MARTVKVGGEDTSVRSVKIKITQARARFLFGET